MLAQNENFLMCLVNVKHDFVIRKNSIKYVSAVVWRQWRRAIMALEDHEYIYILRVSKLKYFLA